MPDRLYDISADLDRALAANPQYGGSYIPFGGNPVYEEIANYIVQPLMPTNPMENQRYLSMAAEREWASMRMAQRYRESAERQMGPYNAYQTLNEAGGGLIMGLGSAFGHPLLGMAGGLGAMMTNMPQNVAEFLGFAPPAAYRDDFTMESMTQLQMAETIHRAAWSTLDPLATGGMRGVSGQTARHGAENMYDFMRGYGYQGLELTRIMPALEQAGAFEGVNNFDELIDRAQGYIEQISSFIQRTRASLEEGVGMAVMGVNLGGDPSQVGQMMGATSVYTNAAGIPISTALQATQQLAQPFEGMAGDYSQLITNFSIGSALTRSMSATDPNMYSDQIWRRAGGVEGVETMAQSIGINAWQTPTMYRRAAAFASVGSEEQWTEYARTGDLPEGMMTDFENLTPTERYRAYFDAGNWMASHSGELIDPVLSGYLEQMPEDVERSDYRAVSGYLFREHGVPTGRGYGLAQRHFLTTSPYAAAEQFDAYQAGTVEARFQMSQSRVEDLFARSARRELLREADYDVPIGGNLYEPIVAPKDEEERFSEILNRPDVLRSEGGRIRLGDITGTTYESRADAQAVLDVLEANNAWRTSGIPVGQGNRLGVLNAPDINFSLRETADGYGIRAIPTDEITRVAGDLDVPVDEFLGRLTMTGQDFAAAREAVVVQQREQAEMPQMVTRAEIELIDSATQILRDDNILQEEMTRSMEDDTSRWGSASLNYQLARDMTDVEPINPGSELFNLVNENIPLTDRFGQISGGEISTHMDLANQLSEDLYGVSYADASREQRAAVGQVQSRYFSETDLGRPEPGARAELAEGLTGARSGLWGGNAGYRRLSSSFSNIFTQEEQTAILSYYTGESSELENDLAVRFLAAASQSGVVQTSESLRRFAAGQVLQPQLRGIEDYLVSEYGLDEENVRQLLSTGQGRLRGDFAEGSLAAEIQQAARSGGNISGEELQNIIERYLTEVAPETSGGKEAARESNEYLREIANRGVSSKSPMYVYVTGTDVAGFGVGGSGAHGGAPDSGSGSE